jgi:hypothetical protein
MIVRAEDYLAAFDLWLTCHIQAATKSGKDFAYCERGAISALQLDDSGSAWDYAFLEPGAPSPGPAWTVYRLSGVPARLPTPAPSPTVVVFQRRSKVADLVKTLFGPGHFTSPSPKPQSPRLMH